MNLAACANLPRTSENAVWYRLVHPRYMKRGLNSAQTKVAFSRFNPGSFLVARARFATLYFAESPFVAQFEMGGMVGSPAPGAHFPHPRKSFVSLNVQINLQDVMDLTDVNSAQTPLGTNAQELTGDWDGYHTRTAMTSVSSPTGIAPTQELGRALYATGVEGFRSISARVPYAKTLTVFTDKLRSGSWLSYVDPTTGTGHRIGPP